MATSDHYATPMRDGRDPDVNGGTSAVFHVELDREPDRSGKREWLMTKTPSVGLAARRDPLAKRQAIPDAMWDPTTT